MGIHRIQRFRRWQMRITRITRQLLAATLLIGMGGMATPAHASSAQSACRKLSASTSDSGAFTTYQRCDYGRFIRYIGKVQDIKRDGLSARIYVGSRLLALAT